MEMLKRVNNSHRFRNLTKLDNNNANAAYIYVYSKMLNVPFGSLHFSLHPFV